jgi:hypothetical protein
VPNELTFLPFLINPDDELVIELRQQILNLAFEQLASEDPAPGRSLRRGDRHGGDRTPGRIRAGDHDQVRAPWTKHFERTLTRLRDTVRSCPPTPAVSVALRSQLQWHAERVASEVHQMSRDVLAALRRADRVRSGQVDGRRAGQRDRLLGLGPRSVWQRGAELIPAVPVAAAAEIGAGEDVMHLGPGHELLS